MLLIQFYDAKLSESNIIIEIFHSRPRAYAVLLTHTLIFIYYQYFDMLNHCTIPLSVVGIDFKSNKVKIQAIPRFSTGFWLRSSVEMKFV